MAKRIDPEPITIFMAIAAAYAASVATVNFVKTHFPPLPTRLRARLARQLDGLDEHVKCLRGDLNIIGDLLGGAHFPAGRDIRFGTPAFLTPSQIARYTQRPTTCSAGYAQYTSSRSTLSVPSQSTAISS